MTTAQPDHESPVFTFDALFRPDFSRTPQPFYKQMRDTSPVLRTPSMYGGDATMVWLADHGDIDRALHSPEVFSSRWDTMYVPLNIDPPDHAKYRRLLDPLFGPRAMKRLEEPIARMANELIDGFVRRGECDYATEYAIPLPCRVFLELVGLPVEELDDYLRLKNGILRGSGDTLMSQDDPVRKQSHAEIDARFEQLVADRRRAPRDDFWTHLLQAQVEGESLGDDDLLGIFRLLLVAGLDTVTDSLTCFYAFLGRHPSHRARIAADPEMIPAAVEEMLRFESPVTYLPRVATRDTELRGCPIQVGDDVVLLLGSANTDETAFPDPNVVDFDRRDVRHLAFGGGVHRCLGSHLARIELRVSLDAWHRRIPDYHIPDGVELEFAPLLRQVEYLPLVFDDVRG